MEKNFQYLVTHRDGRKFFENFSDAMNLYNKQGIVDRHFWKKTFSRNRVPEGSYLWMYYPNPENCND